METKNGAFLRVSANKTAPANHGVSCARGRWGLAAEREDNRLAAPMVKRDGRLVETTWNEALKVVAEKLECSPDDLESVDGVVRVPELMDAVAAAGMPAIALTDESNLFAMVKFYKAAQAAGVKPIIGVDLLIREAGERAEPSRLTLLCMNAVGYGNLTRLVTKSYLEGARRDGTPLIDLKPDHCVHSPAK